MIRAGIIGVSGYVGIEICRLLHQHPNVKITQITTQTYAGKEIAEVYPHLASKVHLMGNKINFDILNQECDVIFISLPHGHAINMVPALLQAGKKVIDLGGDFRLKKPADYENWYQLPSASTDLLNKAIYGLPETSNKEAIAKTNLLANPGCHPTAVILGAMPLLKEKIVNPEDCIFDVKAGVSGTGSTLSAKTSFCTVSENLAPYKVAGLHRHTPEIEQELSIIAKKSITVQFTPQLVPILRGILSTAYFKLLSPKTEQEIHALYKRVYENEPFIRICPLGTLARVKNVRGTNFCDISVHVDARTGRVIVLSVIDNLIKGAAGQAIQNMNLMYQLPQTLGLDQYVAVYP